MTVRARTAPGLAWGLACALVCALLPAACGLPSSSGGGGFAGRSDPAPLPRPRPTPPANFVALTTAVQTESLAAPAPGVNYRVVAGDSVHAIARRFGVPIRGVIDVNGLAPPYRLRIGQTLLVPRPRGHRVAAGDTVYGISRRYGVDMAALTRANGLEEPFRILPGQSLVIPGADTPLVPPAPDPVVSLVAEDPDRSAAPEGIAREELVLLEEASTSRALVTEPGAPPVPSRRPASGRAGRESVASQPAPRETTRPAPRDSSAPSTSRRGASPPSAPVTKSTPPRAIPKPPARQGGKFLWPVNGRVIGRFGPLQGGRHNDGINIAAPRGVAVHAAENGVVAYAGNELRGFGNLVLLKHSDGWVTAYAHAERLLVAPGQFVKRGEPIARIGSSGNVAQPQLHFEVRKGTRAVDPLDLLGPRPTA